MEFFRKNTVLKTDYEKSFSRPYIIYARERFFIICFQNGIFSEKLHVFCPVSYFSNMLHNGFRHADGFTSSFVLIQKKK